MSVPVLWLDTVDSTNAEARRRAEGGDAGPLWIAARNQTAGHGRRGRPWSTLPGNLAATLLTASPLAAAEAAGVSFVAALAVADLACAYVPEALVALKWPNDVLLDGRKLSGVLVESGPKAGGGVWLAVGVGVNLAAAPADVERPAAALAQHLAPDRGAPPAPDEALNVLAAAFDRWNSVWAEGGLAPILAAWSGRSRGLPGPCTARLANETLAGNAEGLDSEGCVRLRLPDGRLRRIAAGEVYFGGS
jgi:BirA family biotin operon repressor/biotin-[acetyl-CoA-carboxylase] ligase